MSSVQEEKFLIIDANSLLHRAYHALPPLKTKKGEVVNAVYGFLLVFLKALQQLKPNYVIACFDIKGPTFRHKEFKNYKAKRPPAPDELYQQIEKIKEILKLFGVKIFEKPGYEADDLIGTIKTLLKERQIFPKPKIFILSGDLDILQLVDEKTFAVTMRKGLSDSVIYSVDKVVEKYDGLKPSQLSDMRGLKGDASDNIPGIPGVGEKTAIKILKEFGTLENLYQAVDKDLPEVKKIPPSLLEKIKNYRDQALLSKKIAQINTHVPIEFSLKDYRFNNIDFEKIEKIFKDYEFFSLLPRIDFLRKKENTSTLSFSQKKPEKGILKEIEELFQQGFFSKTIYELEKDLIEIIELMEKRGIFVERECLKKLNNLLTKQISKIEQKIYSLTKEAFNLNSPQQLSRILFEKLGINSNSLKRTPKGAISTNATELQKIKNEHPVVELVLKYRELIKLKSGFVERLIDFINPQDQRVHPRFNQLGAETGRMSCREPNLQNIPLHGELAQTIRKCFKAPEGWFLVSADYSQMELRVAAFLSGDEKLLEAFRKREDIHSLTAKEVFNLDSLEDVTPEQRKLAKALNFGVLYGMGKSAFAQATGILPKEAEIFIKKYFERFSAVADYREDVINEAKENGFVETLFGRKRLLPEINSRDPRLNSQAERMAINTKIQGTASDIIKMAMVRLKKEGVLDKNCWLVVQIHDELLFEVKKEFLEEKIKLIKQIMENVVNFDPPLKVEIGVGPSWGEIERVNNIR